MEDVLTLDRGSGTSVTVYLHGATVTSWKCNGEEFLFVSKNAVFDNKKAIRGGIPVVFPNFGPWDLGPQHGFARTSKWAVEKAPQKDSDGNVTAVLVLTDSEESRKMWNYKFKLTYILCLGEKSFTLNFKVENTDPKPFSFTCLLHTYFHVPDVTKSSVSGLNKLSYVDKVKGGVTVQENDGPVVVSENVDRVYMNTPEEHSITNVTSGKTMVVKKQNFPDTVLWNPWKDKAAAMSDFGDDEYPSMLCVEAGYVSKPVELQAGTSFEASQVLSIK